MKQARFWLYLPALCMLALPLLGQSRNELKLGNAVAKVGTNAKVPLTLSTTDQVQGLVAAFEWDGAGGTGANLIPGATLATADTVVTRVEATYMVLGVVMDSDGSGGEIISPGADQPLAIAEITCSALEQTTVVSFADGKYATVNGGPLLDNIVVVGGLSIGATEGLILTSGSFQCVSIVNKFYIAPGAMNTAGRCGDATVLMDNKGPVEGYVVALCHDASVLDLTGITVGAAATAQAEDFNSADVSATGGTLGVVIDLVEPFTNNMIPAGEARHIATYNYCCK